MKNSVPSLLMSATLAALLTFGGSALALQAPAASKTAKSPEKTATPKAAPAAAPTDAEIASAKAKGLVWVNTSSKVYHMEGSFYGKTKAGKFMTADEANKAGYRPAKEPTPPKAKTTKATTPDAKKK